MIDEASTPARNRGQATDRQLTPASAGGQAGRLAARSDATVTGASMPATQARLDEVRCEQVFAMVSGDHGREVEERAAVLALAEAAGMDGHRVAAAIEANGSALRLLRGDRAWLDQWEVELADQTADLVGPAELERAGALILEQVRCGVDVHTVLDHSYPINLRLVHDLPAALFVKGALPRTRRTVAIVGARRPTAGGNRLTIEIAEALASEGMVIVSELASGVAATALRCASSAGGLVVAVHAAGIDVPCSAERERLAGDVRQAGAVVTASTPGARPSRRAVRMRAGLVSGLASTVVAVEGHACSAVAKAAFEQGRSVLFLAGLAAEEPWAHRCLSRGLGEVVGSPAELTERVRRLTEPIETGIVT